MILEIILITSSKARQNMTRNFVGKKGNAWFHACTRFAVRDRTIDLGIIRKICKHWKWEKLICTYHREYESTSWTRERRLVMPCARYRLCKMSHFLKISKIDISALSRSFAYLSKYGDCRFQNTETSHRAIRGPDPVAKNRTRLDGSSAIVVDLQCRR